MKIVDKWTRALLVLLAAAAFAAFDPAFAGSGEVNVYTYRESKLIQPLFDFT